MDDPDVLAYAMAVAASADDWGAVAKIQAMIDKGKGASAAEMADDTFRAGG